jgi:hypothetical protein
MQLTLALFLLAVVWEERQLHMLQSWRQLSNADWGFRYGH